METYYPYDAPPPVVFNVARPAGGRRGRRPTEQAQQPFYVGRHGELLVPSTGHHRSSSMGGPRPGIQIVNEQVYDDGGRRPRSIVYHDDYYHPRSRSHSRSPMRRDEVEYQEKLKRLEELERKDEERELEKQFKEKALLKKAKEEEEKKEQEELKKKAVEEWKEKEREKKEKEREEKEKTDKETEEQLRKVLWHNGYTNSEIDKMVEKSKKLEKGEDVPSGRGGSTSKVIALSRPTYLRIKKKYIDPATLDRYQLPWQWDDNDDDYIIIKKWVNEHDQEILFQHTRTLRETKRLMSSTTQFRKDKDKQLLLVKKKDNRSKSPVRIVRF